jgi:hypothetical protein
LGTSAETLEFIRKLHLQPVWLVQSITAILIQSWQKYGKRQDGWILPRFVPSMLKQDNFLLLRVRNWNTATIAVMAWHTAVIVAKMIPRFIFSSQQ